MALFQLERKSQVLTVDMNEVQFCNFSTKTNAIGTRNLKGCHVVIIFSSRGAILAHIAPGPSTNPPRSLESMNPHVLDNMSALSAIYHSHQSFFPGPGTETHTVHAWLGGELGSPDQKGLIERSLTAIGLPRPVSYRYDVNPMANTSPDSSKGTVVMLGSSPPRLLVEDKIVSPRGQTLTSSASLIQSPSASSSSANVSAGIPNSYTGWVHVGDRFVAYDKGVAVAQQQTFPPNQTLHDPRGWSGTAKNWARWDGDRSHGMILS